VSAYRHLLGQLLFVTHVCRADAAAAVNALGRHQQSPSLQHWRGLLGVLKYLWTTARIGITFTRQRDGRAATTLVGYSDAEHAGDPSDRRSVMAHVFMLCGGLIDYRSARQGVTALSSTEAEYLAAGCAAQQLAYLRRLLEDVGLRQPSATILFEDNCAVLKIAANEFYCGRLKHLDIRHFYLRELIEGGSMQMRFCPSKRMFADALTKPIPATLLRQLCDGMGLSEL
jgi:hypothetical protein